MNENSTFPVSRLLPAAFRGLEQAMKTDINRESKSAGGFPGFAWKIAGTEATHAIHEALQTDAFGLLARGWCFARELHSYKDKTKYPPDRKIIVSLGEHTVSTEVHPRLILTIGATHCKPIRFTLVIKALFKVAALVIQDGHIIGVDAGDCTATAQLKYGEFNLHDVLKSHPLHFPGKLQFKSPGLALA